MKKRLAPRLLTWYRSQKRILPWRDSPDPYAVWVSEIMLQQTQVNTVIPYFEKWMRLFPTVNALARADERDVLNVWEGLGYYSRARNLHKASKIILEKFNGELPRNMDELRSLPGIGRYTVGAIASMAFGMDEPTLDGNIRRVYARLFDVDEFADSAAGEKILWQLAAQNLPHGEAGDYNQALMDLGATICLPKNPRCEICPLKALCLARKNETQNLRPRMKPKKKTPHFVHGAAVIVERGRVLLHQRAADGLLGGLWEFPNARVADETLQAWTRALKTETQIEVEPKAALRVVRHAYSHFRVAVHPFFCEKIFIPKNKNLKWIRLIELENYPMGKIDRQIALQIK